MERKKIERLLAKERYEDAYALIQTMLNDTQTNFGLTPLKGYIEMKLEKFDIAKNTLKSFLKKDPNSHESWKYLAEIYLSENEYEKAYTSYKMCLKKSGATPYVYKRVISLALFFKQYEEVKAYANMTSLHKNMLKNIDLGANQYQTAASQANVENYKSLQFVDNKETALTDDEIIRPSYRNELVHYVFALFEKQEFEKGFTLLRKSFNKKNNLELAEYIIFIEWYDCLFVLLNALNKKNCCMVKLCLSNTLIHVFEKIKNAFYPLFYFLIDEHRYDDLRNTLTTQYYDNSTHQKVVEIIKDVMKRHPDYDLNSRKCDCEEEHSGFAEIYNFSTKKNHIQKFCNIK